MTPLLSFQESRQVNEIGGLAGGGRLVVFEANGAKGVAVVDAGSASARQSKPVQLEFYGGPGQIEEKAAGYETFQVSSGHALGIGPYRRTDGITLRV